MNSLSDGLILTMHTTHRMKVVGIIGIAFFLGGAPFSWSAPKPKHVVKAAPAPVATASPEDKEDAAEVEKIKKKYWTQGEEGEVGVVQNRLYTKSKKFELVGFGGFQDNDPFLDVKTAGGSLGFHFSEILSLHAIYQKYFVSASSALKTLESTLSTTANTNKPKSYVGGELNVSVLYGKLSLIGKKILYFDLHLIGGGGSTSTENNSSFTTVLGIGQTLYLNRWLSLRADYRWMHYTDTIIGRVATGSNANLGRNLGDRSNDANTITIGLALFLDLL